jgi:uncharacterized repeat protein (TIGR01451 family)
VTSCGTANVIVSKTQKIYTDAALTTLALDQNKVRTGHYIQYTITARNVGDTWARSSKIADTLPSGVTYIPDSALLNGASMGLVTYPAAGFSINSPGALANIIRFSPDPDTATLKFIVQVTATTGSIQNRALVAYVDSSGLTSDPPDCTTGVNCGGTDPVIVKNADILLVKRITAINGNRVKNPNDNTPLNLFVDDVTSPVRSNDNNLYWPSPTASYLLGATNAGVIKPGDEIEYTIYFLNAGAAASSQVRICDRLAPFQALKPDTYGAGQDLQLTLGTSPAVPLTSALDGADRVQLIPKDDPVPSTCRLKQANDNGTLVMDLTGTAGAPNLPTVPFSFAAGQPNDSYGFVRFVTIVQP